MCPSLRHLLEDFVYEVDDCQGALVNVQLVVIHGPGSWGVGWFMEPKFTAWAHHGYRSFGAASVSPNKVLLIVPWRRSFGGVKPTPACQAPRCLVQCGDAIETKESIVRFQLLFVSLVLGFAGCAAQTPPPAKPIDLGAPTMFFNITSGPDQTHRVTMALQLANHALAAKRRVVLFLNVEGVQLAKKDLDPKLAFHAKPVKELIASVIKKGAEVHVCPHCIAALKIDKTMLIDKAKVTSRSALFAFLGPNTQVFSY
jgi:predicted peroxiredoxin